MASGQESNIRYVAVGVTNVGRVREHNEDNFLLVDLALDQRGDSGKVLSGPVAQRGLSLVVADGMGGAAAGEVASKMAVDGLHGEFKNADLGGTVRAEPDVIGLLETAINKSNEAIFRLGQESKEHTGMGTTLTASVVLGDSLYLSQVGDSRGYILRKGKLVQMTRDQSLIGQLIEEGTLTEEQAEKLGGKNIILQALGVEETLKIDSKRYEILRGDTLLLCSDGLSGMVPDARMEEILTTEADLGTAAGKLIEAANANGGKDNITVILARFEGEGLREPLQPLTDAEKTGGSFHAPPPPKSNAGRNAVLATAGLLAIVGAWLFWPKAVLLKVTVAPESATVTVKGAPDGGPAGFERTGGTEPGKVLEISLPRGGKFVISAEAEGYERQEHPLSTDVKFAEMEESFTLVRTPATSLDVVPPSHGGKPLKGVRVSFTAEEGQPSVSPVEVRDGPPPEFPERFNAGRWTAKAERRGFQEKEIPEFDVASRVPFVLKVPDLVEHQGALVVRNAPLGAEVMILDGEDPLLDAAEKVTATRSTRSIPVRATEVTVQVTRQGHRTFVTRVVVEKDRETEVTLSGHLGEVILLGPRDHRVTVRQKDRPSNVERITFDDKGRTHTLRLAPAVYEVTLKPPGGEEGPPATLVVEPGQIIETEVDKLPR